MDDYEFALCLTHDVDRPYKTYQHLYYAVSDRDPSHLTSFFSRDRPYWQFEEAMALEDRLGVRSSWYFLNEKNLLREKPPWEWLQPKNWQLFAGRYDITDEEIVEITGALERGGWEVGLHGSYESFDDLERLRYEKAALEDLVDAPIVGGRQHYLNLEQPRTWAYHREIGLQYDASLGSSETYGFDGHYDVLRPFDDEFVVFPLTIMERPLLEGHSSVEESWQACLEVLEEAARNEAVMTVLWHPRYLNEAEFPGYRTIYERLIREAKAMGAWVGPCRDWYEQTLSRQVSYGD
ncbi:polysaccharide deacetylase family protein [Natronosalvus amylolyticus]|uniref:polysaccharide deacetylase family protein n=1 Tax=Natronosalvus amylolyticus TaxID=2961994 RepID=UPI0020C9F3DE|nr:polysaccharide deacetylase family protein [Natronosalvus amylolyticus]